MKVLYVLDSFPKLSETFILNEIVELMRKGIDVRILALRNPHESSINEDVLNYKLLDRTEYFQLPAPKELRFYYTFSPLFYKHVFKSIKFYDSISTMKHIVRLLYYSHYFRSIDLVHAHFAFEAAVLGMQISKVLYKPFTFTAHAYEIFSKPFYSKERLNLLAKNAEKIITPSVFNKNYIVEETHCAEDKIEIVRATISQEKFIKKKLSRESEQKIKIIAIGRLTEKKGFEYLIRAMTVVMRDHPSVYLTIIGGGYQKQELIELTKNLGLADCINFTGEKSNEYCVQELSNSDIAVLPCVVANDGDLDVCPLTLQESMAMEIPVVSTTVGSIPELIEDGKEGLLVPERNESALAHAIIQFIDNPSLRQEMGKKGKEKISREFNIQIQANKLLEIWRKIV